MSADTSKEDVAYLMKAVERGNFDGPGILSPEISAIDGECSGTTMEDEGDEEVCYVVCYVSLSLPALPLWL